jgi:hypothetical protein
MFVKLPNTIKIVYNILDKEYLIFTKFIPVILDYGRSYINCSKLDSTLITSETYAEKACNSDCNPSKDKHTCENNSLKFYKYNDKWFDNSNFYFINPRVKNESFDLRFINSIMTQNVKDCDIKQEYLQKFNIKNNPEWFDPKTKNVTYGVKERLIETGKIRTSTDIIVFLISYWDSNKNFPVPIVKNINEVNEVIKIDCDINKKIKWSHTNSRQTAKDLGEMPPIQSLTANPIKQVSPVKKETNITMKEWDDLVDTAEAWRKEAIKCDPSLA